jgi:cytochrome P450
VADYGKHLIQVPAHDGRCPNQPAIEELRHLNTPEETNVTNGAPSGGLPLIGHAHKVIADPLGFVRRLHDYGDLVSFSIGPRTIYAVNTPELIQELLIGKQDYFTKGDIYDKAKAVLGEGLFISEGDFHRRQRALIQPAFHRTRIADYIQIMVEAANHVADSWSHNTIVDIKQITMCIATEIITRALFGKAIDDKNMMEFMSIQHTLLKGFFQRGYIPLNFYFRLPLPENRRYQAAVEGIRRLIGDIITDHRGEAGSDIISKVIHAQDEDGNTMPFQQSVDEAATLMMAGADTTGSAIAWMLYDIATHPAVAQRIYAEIDALSTSDIPYVEYPEHLPYLRLVAKETLRVYAPAWVLPRRALPGAELGGQPIPTDCNVVYSPFAIHHDPRYFPNPDEFDPGRWETGSDATVPRFAYVPFGAGSRICVGEHFAVTEMCVVVATLLRRWTMQPPEQPVRPAISTVLWPKHLLMTATERVR